MGRKYLEFVATVIAERWRPREQKYPTMAILVVAPEEGLPGDADGSRPSRREIAVKASIEDADDDKLLRPQVTLRFFGYWDVYKGEKQFVGKTFVRATPRTRAAIITYLKEAPGIGSALSLKLWKEFESDAVKVLRRSPEAAAAAVPGLSLEAAEKAAEWLQFNEDTEQIRMELEDLLGGHGFPKATVKKAIKEWGAKAAELIQRDPYILQRFRGIGWKRCDALYLALGKPPAAMKRQAYCAWYAVAHPTNGNGSTWHYREVAVRGLNAMVGGARVDPDKAIALGIRGGIVRAERTERDQTTFYFDGDLQWLADARKADNETALAFYIAEALEEDQDYVPLLAAANCPAAIPEEEIPF